jgi:hypothetical protein
MIHLSLYVSINQAMFWTYRAKDLAGRNDLKRLEVEQKELHWYREATIQIYEQFVAMTDAATAFQFDKDRSEICSKLAKPVEDMIHRLYYLQELEFLSAEQQAAIKEFQVSLQQVSDYILPIAFPITDMLLGNPSKKVPATHNPKVGEPFSTAAFSHEQDPSGVELQQPLSASNSQLHENGSVVQVVIGVMIAAAFLYLLFIR